MSRRNLINEKTEVAKGRMVFSKMDIEMMFIDRGCTTLELAEELGVGRHKVYKILKNAGINSSQHSELTPRRLRILKYIKYYQIKNKCSPTIKEIADAVALKSCVIVYHIKRLQENGFLIKEKRKQDIFITEKGNAHCGDVSIFAVNLRKRGRKKK